VTAFRIGNAPCSWGTLEFDGLGGESVPYSQMLDELVDAGYTGTELGDWGYMPTDVNALRQELEKRHLTMLGAFVGTAFAHSDKHAEGIERSLRTAKLLADVASVGDSDTRPFMVLADENGSDPKRTAAAGRVTPELTLDAEGLRCFARGVDEIARRVHDETGLRTVVHHHCAGFVETSDEIEALLDATDPDRVGLVFDTGHYLLGNALREVDALEGLRRFGDRIWYVHFKDFDPTVAELARQNDWNYFEQLQHGVFCELGQGRVDFPAVLAELRSCDYRDWVLVEQDVLPGMGAPGESARRNRDYLRGIGV
jgi:inosose dehydratase